MCDAIGTCIGSADCAGISCRLNGNQLIDRNGVPEADRAFCDAKNGLPVRDATAKGLFLTRNSPSERTTQSDDCLPSKYACNTYPGGPHHGLIEVCDAQSNWQLKANCNCAEGCHLGGTIYEDSHGVLQGDTAFYQCANAHDSADSGSLTGGILADNSFDVAVRDDVASNPTTAFTDFGQPLKANTALGSTAVTFLATLLWTTMGSPKPLPRSASVLASQLLEMLQTMHLVILLPISRSTKWSRVGAFLRNSCPYNRFVYVYNSENQWLVSADCSNYGCCQLSGNTFVDDSHINEGDSAFCVCNKKSNASGIPVAARDTVPTTIDQRGKDISSNDGCIPGLMPADDYESILVCDA